MANTADRLRAALATRYVIQHELGIGGMATVYLARDVKHDRQVAIKVLHSELAATLGVERFVREIEITAHLEHPHILPLYDSGEAAGGFYYVMPYVEGATIRDRLETEGSLPLEEAVQIARDVAAALDYAHKRGIVHRDIKPENILLSEGGARVADFGIAWALSEARNERLTQTGLSLGTPAYMSPEQSAGQAKVDGRSDIYSLACVLYEMLTGSPPFTGRSPLAVLARHSTDPVPSIRSVRATVPLPLEEAVLRALAKVPADRFQTAGEFAAALTASQTGPVALHAGGDGFATPVDGAAYEVWRGVPTLGASARKPSFWSELKRRNVYKVAVVYGALSWGVIQVADTVGPFLGISHTIVTYIILTVIAGLPLALFLAWAYELTPAGIQPTRPIRTDELAAGHRRRTGLPKRRGWIVLAGSAVTLALAAAGWEIATKIGGPQIQRLAVLPLTNLTNDSEQQYLVEGVHEALISQLAQLGISVIARRTMMQYLNTDKSITQIASELGVDAVMEGSLFREGDSLEISARLYDGDNEREMWNGLYGVGLANVFGVYSSLARSVANRIQLALRPEVEARLNRTSAVNPAVYEAYLRGMYYLNKSTPEDFEKGLGYLRSAVDANPADAHAYAGLASGYVTLGHGPAPPPDIWPRARAAAERAVRLDSTLADAWAALARVRTYYEWDWEGAELAFERANDLNPSSAMNHFHHAWYLLLLGRLKEAIAEHERARELDPLTPLYTVWIPGLYLYMGQYRKALVEARKTAKLYPDNAIPLLVLGASAAQMGQYEEAIAAHEKMAEINPAWKSALGCTYALAGRTADALNILAELEAKPPTPWGALGLADLNATLGNKDEAFRWLGYEQPHAWLPWSRWEPFLKPLRGDPRFQDLLRRLKLPTSPKSSMAKLTKAKENMQTRTAVSNAQSGLEHSRRVLAT